MEHYLRAYTNWHQDNWARWLAMAQLVYNTTEHSATKLAPAVALKGFNPSLQINVNNPQRAAHLDVNEWLEDLHAMQEILKQQLQSAKDSMKHHYNKHHLNHTF